MRAESCGEVFRGNAEVAGSCSQQAARLQRVALTGSGVPAGVALAVILSSVRHISDKVFLEAAKVSLGAERPVAPDMTGVTFLKSC